MSVSTLQRLRQLGSGWLLGLALLLPLAQSALAWHVISHGGEAGRQSRDDERSLPHGKDCPVCQMAAALGAGGPPCAPPRWTAPVAEQAPPVAVAAAAWLAPVAVAYRSRAPPGLAG